MDCGEGGGAVLVVGRGGGRSTISLLLSLYFSVISHVLIQTGPQWPPCVCVEGAGGEAARAELRRSNARIERWCRRASGPTTAMDFYPYCRCISTAAVLLQFSFVQVARRVGLLPQPRPPHPQSPAELLAVHEPTTPFQLLAWPSRCEVARWGGGATCDVHHR